MRHLSILLLLLLFLTLTVPGQTETGYVLSGYGDTYTNGGYDLLVYRVDLNGAKRWRKNYGGIDHEFGGFIQQTSDGGYVLGGHSRTYTHGNDDYLVYKLAADGSKQWRMNYGGISSEYACSIQQTADGGYIIAGDNHTYSNGQNDFLVYKLAADGAKQWRKNYGGSQSELEGYIRQTTDGGYILGGYGNSASYTHGSYDFVLYKLAADGTKQWRKSYGGDKGEYGGFVRQTADGGYILSGDSWTYTNGRSDFLVYRLDSAGTKLWRKNYGGQQDESRGFIHQTADGGFILSGDGDTYSHGGEDLLVYKLDANGAKQWRKNYGGEENDQIGYSLQIAGGGYVLAGHGRGYSNFKLDFILFKLNADGTKLWRKSYGGENDERLELVGLTYQ